MGRLKLHRACRGYGRVKTKLPVFVIVLFLSLVLSQGIAFADQLVQNGSFKRGTSNWSFQDVAKGIKAIRDDNGYDKTGSLRFEISGRRSRGEIHATQPIATPIQANSSGKIEFAWKKNWSSILPVEHKLYINLIKPNDKYVTVWIHRSPLNDNAWATQSIDVSKFLDQSGQYSLSFGIYLENGNAKDAAAYIWLDDIKFDISSPGLDSSPRTSFLTPTGASMMTGKDHAVTGIAVDDAGVSKVELALARLYDNSYWNGNSWVKDEFWNLTEIVSGKGKRTSAWSYSWPLPTSDGANFKILARSTDIMGNREVIPVENYVRVDNVGPSGNIYINDAATYANNRRVRADIDVCGAGKMRFSLDNGQTWTAWEKFSASEELTLPKGDGMKVVSAQFKDDYQNIYLTSDSVMLDTAPPVTRHIYPKTGSKKVSPSSKIVAVFYEDMDPLSFRNDGTEHGSTAYIKQGSRWIAAEISYEGKSKTARLVPKQKLDPGTVYTVHLSDGIKDAAGNPLAANFSWNFTTAGSYKLSFEKTIGASGGTLEDNNQVISLVVPQNALETDTLIGIEELRDDRVPTISGATRYSAVYQMTPNRLLLKSPATVKIKYSLDEVPDPTNLRLVSYNEQQNKWELVPNARIDLVNNQVMAPIPYLMTVTIIAQNDPTAPSTVIMSPTGTSTLTEKVVTIYGISTDNGSISRVELKIMKQSDQLYWDGNSWLSDESWVKAKMASKKKEGQAVWSYIWKLPRGDYSTYQLRARAVDNNGNIEPNPNVILVNTRVSQ